MLCQHFHNNFTTNFMWQGIFDIKLRPTIARNKKYCENIVTFCCVPMILFCVTFCCVPMLLFLFSQIW